MTQIKSKRIIILIIILLLLISIILLFLKFKTDSEIKTVETVKTEQQTRMMTDAEKDMVGIDKNQKAEVINDDAGFFIYNVVE